MKTYPDALGSSGAQDDVVRIGRKSIAAFDVVRNMSSDKFDTSRIAVTT